MNVRVPRYRFHKASGQALVEIKGRHIYLGKFDSPDSREKYRRLIAEFMSNNKQGAEEGTTSKLKIEELILQYFRFAKTYYVKNGVPTDEIIALRIVLRRLRKLHGSTKAEKFGPKAFKTVCESLIQKDLSRKYINDSMSRIRRMFRWAVAEELVPPAIFQALATVPELKRGRSAARETEKILPVSDEVVEATLPHLPEVIADMVRLQRLAGMRPAEVCILRPCDIDSTEDVWIYQPSSHKTEHKDKERLIPLGPQAQAIILRYLARDPETFCFRPCDSEEKRRAKLHASRMTPLEHGNHPGSNRVAQPLFQPGESYSTDSYRRAIQRGCKKAFTHPTLANIGRSDLTDSQLKEIWQWQSEHRWAPNQLRHAAATQIRQRFGLEAAQVVLGHSGANVTEVYAERDFSLAAKIAREVG